MISFRYFLFGAAAGSILLAIYFLTLPDHRLHIVYCDVGQGDAAYIHFPTGQDMLIDAGPDDSVLSCLGRHMPFYDRQIDTLMLTHPQKDHLQGFLSVIDRYKIKYMIIGIEGNETDGYKELVRKLQNHHIPIKNLFAHDVFRIGHAEMRIIWPEKDWVLSHIDSTHPSLISTLVTSQSGPAVLGYQSTVDLNGFSYYLNVGYGRFDALFTGDGDQPIQPEILSRENVPKVTVLKYPHHGSRTGLFPNFLEHIAPQLAVISVGKQNHYGHPAPEALKLLQSHKVKYLRTDEHGDIEVVSDGKDWYVK
jgi:competence protein ComEC